MMQTMKQTGENNIQVMGDNNITKYIYQNQEPKMKSNHIENIKNVRDLHNGDNINITINVYQTRKGTKVRTYTRANLIQKYNNAVLSIAKMLEDHPHEDAEGISTALWAVASKVESAALDLIPDSECDTVEELEAKLTEAKLIVTQIEKALQEVNENGNS